MGARFISEEGWLWQPFCVPQFGWALPTALGAQSLRPGHAGSLVSWLALSWWAVLEPGLWEGANRKRAGTRRSLPFPAVAVPCVSGLSLDGEALLLDGAGQPTHSAWATPALTLLVTMALTPVQTPSLSSCPALAITPGSLARAWKVLLGPVPRGSCLPLQLSGWAGGVGEGWVSKACFTCCSQRWRWGVPRSEGFPLSQSLRPMCLPHAYS